MSERDRQREQERWDREDREWTFDARRSALEDFHNALRAMLFGPTTTA